MSSQTSLDTKIINRASKGDKLALGLLYEHYVDAVYRFMSYRTESSNVAEDLTAEVFASVITSIKDYEDRGLPFEAWLFRIARARLADYWRKAERRRDIQVEITPEMKEFYLGESQEDPFQHEDLIEALHYLTPAEYEVVTLRFAVGLDTQETALIVERTSNAVKSMLYRAMEKLRRILKQKNRFYEKQ